MTLIANVRERDCLVSLNPLKFGRTRQVYVTGRRAILQRILYRWCTYRGSRRHAPDLGILTPLIDIGGYTFAPADLVGLRSQLEKQARAENFVSGASVPLSFSEAGVLLVQGSIDLIDDTGKVNLPLEMGISSARAELLKIGGQA
jgi:hypothetical protein